jgi:hypothetical protein
MGAEPEHHPARGVGSKSRTAKFGAAKFHCREGSRKLCVAASNEVTMAATREHDHDRIVETTTQARQAEPGPSVLALLTASTGLAVLILGVIWFVFFRI